MFTTLEVESRKKVTFKYGQIYDAPLTAWETQTKISAEETLPPSLVSKSHSKPRRLEQDEDTSNDDKIMVFKKMFKHKIPAGPTEDIKRTWADGDKYEKRFVIMKLFN